MSEYTEHGACTPLPLHEEGFNPNALLPYGLQVSHIKQSMEAFLTFIGFVNQQLNSRDMERLETMLMPANFSSIVGEFMSSTLPKYCTTIVKNRYHNGHPDLLPKGTFPNDAVQHAHIGVEIKASRYLSGWQGHNPENVWLMVFVFESNGPRDITPKPFRFLSVLGAQLDESDWSFAGRSATSRRTITASVTTSGFAKMSTNWIYRAS